MSLLTAIFESSQGHDHHKALNSKCFNLNVVTKYKKKKHFKIVYQNLNKFQNNLTSVTLLIVVLI